MKFTEKRMNLFDVSDKYYLAHCISADLALGAGIAVEFNKRFNLREKLREVPPEQRYMQQTVLIDRVFNLITKEKYWHKPTYQSLFICLVQLKKMCLDRDIKHLAMPRIGCGRDRLDWNIVKRMIHEVFQHTTIEILVCYI
jgi:hypothetical protein